MRATDKLWTPRETEIAVKAYFDLLKQESEGNIVSRQAVYDKLAARLSRRNRAIEYRFQNIEAILMEENQKSVLGVAPMSHSSRLLRAAVLAEVLGYKLIRA